MESKKVYTGKSMEIFIYAITTSRGGFRTGRKTSLYYSTSKPYWWNFIIKEGPRDTNKFVASNTRFRKYPLKRFNLQQPVVGEK
jgi:hypothetical protein